MATTLHIQTKVLPGHKIEIEAPDLAVGAAVEVTVTPAEAPAERPAEPEKPIWEAVAEIGARVPDEEWAKVPPDLSKNYRHYLYGHRKDDE